MKPSFLSAATPTATRLCSKAASFQTTSISASKVCFFLLFYFLAFAPLLTRSLIAFFPAPIDTLIVWQEPDTSRDIALSFQEAAGCVEIWDLLGVLRGTNEPNSVSSDLRIDLEAPSMENLSTVFDTISSHVRNVAECEQLCHWIVKTEYYMQIFDLFDECEAAGNAEALAIMFRIWRALLFCNNVSLLEAILSEECVLRLFGAFEYDPRVAVNRHVHHREYLARTELQEVVALDNEDLRTRIRQTYYIQYLRDVILAGVIDDGISSTINSFVIYNQMEIVSLVRRDPDVLQNLLRQMQDPEVPDEQFLDKCSFLLELCTLGKMCNVAGRIELYSLLTSLGVFQVLELALRRPAPRIRTVACEILNLTVQHNVSLLRSFVLNEGTKPSFLLLMVNGIVVEEDLGLKSQFSGILTALLDPEGMEKVNAKDQMLSIWYETCMARLMEPLGSPLDENVATKEYVVDLLEFCIRYHDFRIKYFILGNNITKRVVSLTEHRDRYLQLAAVRLVRVIVGIRDSFFDRHICRHHFLDPIIQLLVNNCGANNLVDSAILELLEFIRVSPVPELARELVARHRTALLNVSYVSTCAQLVQMVDTWEKDGGGANGTPSGPGDGTVRKRGREADENSILGGQDDWIEAGDDEGRLVGGVFGHHSAPDSLMEYSIPPPPLSSASSRRMMSDDDGELPLLSRNDTPPMLEMMQQRGGVPPPLSFSGLRLPSEPGALVAGLAAEATRHLAESSTGGPFWDSPATEHHDELDVANEEKDGQESKRRKLPPSPMEALPSLLDEFLADSEPGSN